jgi:hypothetical protein
MENSVTTPFAAQRKKIFMGEIQLESVRTER